MTIGTGASMGTGAGMGAIQLSILIPARKEGEALFRTVTRLHSALSGAGIRHEFVLVNDADAPGDAASQGRVKELEGQGLVIQYVERLPPNHGFGTAVEAGLRAFRGEAVVTIMADGSENPQDVIKFFRKFSEGFDCVFGDRFGRGGALVGYSRKKYFFNRFANIFLAMLFRIRYRDFTNGFKLYSRRAIDGFAPIFSRHFNITIELPIKAFVRGYSVAILPNSWTAVGERDSYLRIGKMGRRYLFTALVLFLESRLAADDYGGKKK